MAAKMKLKVRLFWLWLAVREVFRNGKTDYNLTALFFKKKPFENN